MACLPDLTFRPTVIFLLPVSRVGRLVRAVAMRSTWRLDSHGGSERTTRMGGDNQTVGRNDRRHSGGRTCGQSRRGAGSTGRLQGGGRSAVGLIRFKRQPLVPARERRRGQPRPTPLHDASGEGHASCSTASTLRCEDERARPSITGSPLSCRLSGAKYASAS